MGNKLDIRPQSRVGYTLKKIFRGENLGLLVALIAVITVFSLINPNYFTVRNLRNVFTAGSLSGLICVGEAMLLIGGLLDLSPGSTAAFSGVAAALLLQAGVNVGVVLLIVLFIGIIVGGVNAFFTTQMKISPFIVTLASQQIIRGFCYIISNGESILVSNSFFLSLGTANILGIPFPILFMILVFAIFFVVLTRTRLGRNIYTVGGNPVAARLAGISIKATSYVLFIIMSVLASLGGAILASRMNTGQPQACVGLEFDGITAAILGGVAMSGGSGSLLGAFIGLLILQGFNTGLTIINVQSFWQYVAKGALLLIALSFDYFRSKRRS